MTATFDAAPIPRNSLVARGAYGAAIGCALIALLAIFTDLRDPRGNDFISFWAAGKMALAGNPAAAYDVAAHGAVEASGVPGYQGTNPFPYPPPFLLAVAPFAVLPPAVAQLSWLISSGLLFWLATRRWVPMRLQLSHPPNLVTAIIGQSSLLTGAIVAGGVRLCSTRPWLAGAILGAAIVKPQLALLVPLALAAGGYWRTLAGAATSAVALSLVSLALFGTEPFRAFVEILPFYSHAMEAARWPWVKFGSVYALVRQLGGGNGMALAIHAAVALAAVAATVVAWYRDAPTKMPILLAGCLLISPYLLTYDMTLLVVATAWLARDPRLTAVSIIVWLLLLVPLLAYLDIRWVPATAPLATIVALAALCWVDRIAGFECPPDILQEAMVPRDGIEPPTP